MHSVPPIKITLARKATELKQILSLQAENLAEILADEELRSQGFVTVRHDLDLLTRMNAATAAVIAKDGRKVIGYTLAMTREFAREVPVLEPLFTRQDKLSFRGQLLGETDYLEMGQICVAAAARGQRLADRMYKYMRACYHPRFRYCLTAIDARNTRSVRVHERIGFEVLDRFTADDGHDWILVIWDWRPKEP